MGTASVATGSKSVMTININQVIQDATNKKIKEIKELNKDINNNDPTFFYKEYYDEIKYSILFEIINITERVHKYQKAFNEIIKDFFKADMLVVYSAGFISLNKQYLTIGVNGLTDAAEFLGIEVSDNEQYKSFVNDILETINKCNASAKTKELMYNTEFVPGENLSIKNYN
jgi:ribonucleoside-triphosphate reductase